MDIIKKKKCAIVILIIAVYFLNQMFHIVAINFPKTSDSSTFRLMTYNAYGESARYNEELVMEAFLKYIDSIQSDIIVFQEMRAGYSVTLFNELQKRYPYNSIQLLNKRKYIFGNTAFIFSNYPIKSLCRLDCNTQQTDSAYNEYKVPDKLREYGKSEIYSVILDIKGKDVFLVCCYLKSNNITNTYEKKFNKWTHKLKDYYKGYLIGSRIRSIEGVNIRDSIDNYKLPTIVCGDMNDFDCSKTVKTIAGDDLKNAWWERGFGYGMTYNKYNLKIRIDHILFSKEFDVVRVAVPHLPFSDHYPVVADFEY